MKAKSVRKKQEWCVHTEGGGEGGATAVGGGGELGAADIALWPMARAWVCTLIVASYHWSNQCGNQF